MDASKLMFREGLLKGERILVTGGGTGLGKEMAEAFVKLGAEIIICGRRGEVLKETAAELMGKHGGSVIPAPCDIRSADAIHAMLDEVWADAPLTGLVNNAAGNFISRTQDISPRGFDAIAATVFHGSFYMTLDVGKRWIAEGRKGSVLSILVSWIWNGSAFVVPSAMSKAGLHAMTQSLAVEWGRYGIRLNSIAPGIFPTEGMSARLNPESSRGDLSKTNPMSRYGEMHEFCNLATFLMAPGAEWLTGQAICIDGAQYQATGGNFSALASWTDAEWQAARESIQKTNEKDRAQRTA
ncbi:MAG: SDR family oxidoreductase [Hyphomonadaceae bacterium]